MIALVNSKFAYLLLIAVASLAARLGCFYYVTVRPKDKREVCKLHLTGGADHSSSDKVCIKEYDWDIRHIPGSQFSSFTSPVFSYLSLREGEALYNAQKASKRSARGLRNLLANNIISPQAETPAGSLGCSAYGGSHSKNENGSQPHPSKGQYVCGDQSTTSRFDLSPYSSRILQLPPILFSFFRSLSAGSRPDIQIILVSVIDIITALCLALVASNLSTSHLRGYYSKSKAEGNSSTAEGNSSKAEGNSSTAEGNSSKAEGNSSKAEKNSSTAEGNSSTAEGNSNTKYLQNGNDKAPNTVKFRHLKCDGTLSTNAIDPTIGLTDIIQSAFTYTKDGNFSISSSVDFISCPEFIAAFYLFNPLTVLHSQTLSVYTLRHLFIAASMASSTTMINFGNLTVNIIFVIVFTSIPLAFLTFIFPILPLSLVIPLGHIIYKQSAVHPLGQTGKDEKFDGLFTVTDLLQSLATSTALLTAVLFGLLILYITSYYFNDFSWSFMENCFWAFLRHSNLTPSFGPFWYAITLMFERFKLFFLIAFQGFPFIFAFPAVILFFHSGFPAIISAATILLLLNPYPTPSDFVFITASLLIHGEATMKQSGVMLWVTGAILATTMFPLMKNLWLVRNTGNANFCYLFQLVHFFCTSHLIGTWISSAISVQTKRRKLNLPLNTTTTFKVQNTEKSVETNNNVGYNGNTNKTKCTEN